MADIFTRMGALSLPDAIEAFRYQAERQDDLTGFERYAQRVLLELDVERLRGICDEHAVGVVRIARMDDAFYLSFDRDKVSVSDTLSLLQAEAVLNRLVRLKRKVGERSLSEEACSVLDLRNFQRVTEAVAEIIPHAGTWNPFAQPGTVRCKPGGEWDVRTRFAQLAERISPITHLSYRFDCDAAAGVLVVRFECADASSMPQTVCHEDDACWYELSLDDRSQMAYEHSHRVALVLAAAGFAAGLRIRRVYVEGMDIQQKQAAFTLAFDRPEFVASFAPFAAVLTRTPLLDMVCATACLDHRLGPDESLPLFDQARFLAVRDDKRPLSPALGTMLLADTVADLNVHEPEDDPAMARLEQVRATLRTDMRKGMRELAALVDMLEARCTAAELASEQPLTSQFCENALGRIVLPLLEDNGSTRVYRAPDALFFARAELVQAYATCGALDMALTEAQRLLDASATSVQAHFLLINVLAGLERYDEVVEVCKHGLRVAYERESIAYLLYRLAFALWQTGSDGTALAAYALVPKGVRVSHMATVEMRMLMAELQVEVPPKPDDAADTLRAAGVPLAITEELFNQVADAAVMLVDEGAFNAAHACVGFLWRAFNTDELGVLFRSLQPPAR